MLWLAVLAVSFATITIAELADKTQLVTFSQACKYPAWPVLTGSAVALVVVTFLGVVGGSVLYWLLPPEVLSIVAGALFIVFGTVMLWRWHRGRAPDEGPECAPGEDAGAAADCETSNAAIFRSTFALVALAELGDKTQITVIALTGKYEAPTAVFIGASVGLVLVSAAGVLAGRVVGGRLSMRSIELLAGIIFVALGALFLLDAF
jgi:putative Ca2+/H+ antiporter (TMEM165/GDT1 family)